MNSLVADYGTSSEKSESESDSDSESERKESEPEEREERESRLPRPDFGGSSAKSVFTNPFAEAENASKAILEKHVKMVPTRNKVQMINGKKICWNYRKGRCRFGHTCTFAHDSDLQLAEQTKPAETAENLTPTFKGAQDGGQPIQTEDNPHVVRKKRPGLGNSITPSKKVMKFYKQQKLKTTK